MDRGIDVQLTKVSDRRTNLCMGALFTIILCYESDQKLLWTCIILLKKWETLPLECVQKASVLCKQQCHFSKLIMFRYHTVQ